jgi:DNA uptake protein ComE-like DNA-binding protein
MTPPSNPVPGRAAFGLLLLLAAAQAVSFVADRGDGRCEPVTPQTTQLRIDPNTASIGELRLLPGVGEKLAANIIRYRESAPTRPAFRTTADLDRVERIGPGKIAEMRPWLALPDEPAPDPADRTRSP